MHAPHVSPMPVRPWRSDAGFGPVHLCARVLARDQSPDRGVRPVRFGSSEWEEMPAAASVRATGATWDLGPIDLIKTKFSSAQASAHGRSVEASISVSAAKITKRTNCVSLIVTPLTIPPSDRSFPALAQIPVSSTRSEGSVCGGGNLVE
jgi:hypothetical protein